MSLTLPEALRRLHAAGRIVAPWLSGMLLAEWDARTTARVAWFDGDGGQRVNLSYSCPSEGVAQGGWLRVESAKLYAWRGPALDDPATVGCLTALLREAANDPAIYLCPDEHEEEGLQGWDVRQPLLYGSKGLGYGETEGQALAAALVLLAEGLPMTTETT